MATAAPSARVHVQVRVRDTQMHPPTRHGMLRRMKQRERLTISLDQPVAARVRQCGARTRGGASGYLERLVRADALREAASSMARWYAANPTYVEDSLAETAAAFDEAG